MLFLHMFSLSVVCTLNIQLKLLPFKRYTVLRQTVNGNFNLTPTVLLNVGETKMETHPGSATGPYSDLSTVNIFLLYVRFTSL